MVKKRFSFSNNHFKCSKEGRLPKVIPSWEYVIYHSCFSSWNLEGLFFGLWIKVYSALCIFMQKWWSYNVCHSSAGFTDDTPRDYHCNLGPDGRRRDADDRPELCRGTVEFVASKEYMVSLSAIITAVRLPCFVIQYIFSFFFLLRQMNANYPWHVGNLPIMVTYICSASDRLLCKPSITFVKSKKALLPPLLSLSLSLPLWV